MSADPLQRWGLSTQEGGAEAELDLRDRPLQNPLSRRQVDRVRFMRVSDRLLVIDPPEVVGLPPLNLGNLADRDALVAQLTEGYNAHLRLLHVRSAELQALGMPAQVDPETLELRAVLDHAPFRFVLLADKQGQFRVAQMFRDGAEAAVPTGHAFDLSEFREPNALAGYLVALVSGSSGVTPVPMDRPAVESVVLFSELAARFGRSARLPPRSALEVLVELRVGRVRYRFAAARLTGRSFRGLLAGPQGKLWAERFELEDFAGPAALLAYTLNVPVESVTVIGPGDEA